MFIIFENANEAFDSFYKHINLRGEISHNGTKQFRNIGFYITNPLDNHITSEFRNWNPTYAEREWNWYLSANPSAVEIAKFAPIWKQCMDKDGNVNSNYGYQWSRGNQMQYVLDELSRDPNSRRASISIYDAKDRNNFENDTPCTYSINFYIDGGKLSMSVLMRSNDLWYGFCNDQYCFSKLQELIAEKLSLPVGLYYHFAQNLHLYEQHWMKDD